VLDFNRFFTALALDFSTLRLAMTVVTSTDTWPPPLDLRRGRFSDDLSAVLPTDDVVMLYGPGMGPSVRKLAAMLGPAMPPVFVMAPTVDPGDVTVAFEHGATSYVLDCPYLDYLPQVARVTARRTSCLDPRVASVLVRHAQQPAGSPLAMTGEWPAVQPRQRPGAPGVHRAQAGPGAWTAQEQQIMELVVAGRTSAEIAARLRVSESVVRGNLSTLYGKLRMRRLSEAIVLWLGPGAVDQAARPARPQPPAQARPRRAPRRHAAYAGQPFSFTTGLLRVREP
jgi:DNA-binding NarL/FixJ family response regulator